ncbi:MAG TPA: asparagine synthase-related protein [Micromonosporaceae bacterium]|nr:asparagine synthase-related protein [Micromonosporaceae bacterium]
MLRARIEAAACTGPWAWSAGRWRCGASWVEPFANPAIESFAATDGDETVIVIREALRGSPAGRTGGSELRDVVDPATAWPADFHVLRLRPEALTITAGCRGYAPVYLATAAGVLDVSWDLPDLAGHLTADDLDTAVLARYLTRQGRYGVRTLWPAVTLLTERSTAVFDGSGLRLRLPAPAVHYRARDLVPGADPVGAFDQLLAAELGRRAAPADTTFVEVSGGLDSANVAVTAARALPGTRSYGLLVGGVAGDQQRQRRRYLVDLLGLHDVTRDALRCPPFAGRHRTAGELFDPAAEPYWECLDAVVAAAVELGARVVLTGIGGDELMGRQPDEKPAAAPPAPSSLPGWHLYTRHWRRELGRLAEPEQPVSAAYEPTLAAAAARAPVFLRRGVWPVNPLAAPELVRFCEWLPVGWRSDRCLLRSRLARAGLAPQWSRPALPENFAHVMACGLTQYALPLLPDLMAGSRLAALGVINPVAVLDAAARYRAGRGTGSGLYEIVNLELALRGLAKSAT